MKWIKIVNRYSEKTQIKQIKQQEQKERKLQKGKSKL